MGSSGYPKGGWTGPRALTEPKPKRRRSAKHVGMDVAKITLERSCCVGAGKDESIKEVDGYELQEIHGLGATVTMCRECAVKLALKILELESL